MTYDTVSPYIMPGLIKGTALNLKPSFGISRMDDILEVVLLKTKIDIEDFFSDKRNAPIVEARQIFCFLCKKHTSCSLIDIAKRINRHRTTVMHSIENFQNLIDTEPDTKELVRRIEIKIF